MKDIYRTIFEAWIARNVPDLVARENPLERYRGMKPRKIITVTGMRRTGKTYMLFQLAGDDRKRVMYVNFDDDRIPRDQAFLTGLLPAMRDFNGEVPATAFFDELQTMPGWSRWLRRIYDEGSCEIYVTGSTSELSGEEIPYELRGRCLETVVRPLTYTEFLSFKSANDSTTLLEEYLYYGGMPEVVLADKSLKFDILHQYYATMLRRDVVQRFNIRNYEGLKALLALLLNSTQFTVSKLCNSLAGMHLGIGKETILKYISYVESAYFLHQAPVLSFKVKDQMRHPRKVYFTDTGFISALSTRFSKNYGRLCENAVANRLSIDGKLHYWKSTDGREVDFAVRTDEGVSALVQSCWEPWEDTTLKREMSALVTASSELSCDNLLVVTRDRAGTEEHRGKKIRFVRLGEWLEPGNQIG